MEYQIEDITAYDNDGGKGLIASVRFSYDDHCKWINVRVHLPLDRDKSLADVESEILEEAKKQLKELAAGF